MVGQCVREEKKSELRTRIGRDGSNLVSGSENGRGGKMATEWFVLINGKERGPFSLAELKEAAAKGKISENLPVKKGADGDWFPAKRLKELPQARVVPPPPPKQSIITPGGVACPHCGDPTDWEPSLAGRVVTCPACSGSFRMVNSPIDVRQPRSDSSERPPSASSVEMSFGRKIALSAILAALTGHRSLLRPVSIAVALLVA